MERIIKEIREEIDYSEKTLQEYNEKCKLNLTDHNMGGYKFHNDMCISYLGRKQGLEVALKLLERKVK